MSALTFIVVSILRSGLITTRGALALILGRGSACRLWSDRHFRHQAGRALRSRSRRRGHGQRETVEIQAHCGVIPRRRHDHPRPGPSQGCRGTRWLSSPGSRTCWKAPATPWFCLSGRRIPDVHRAVLERGLRLRHQSGGRRSHLRRPDHHAHLRKLSRFERHPLPAVGQSDGAFAPGRHVHGAVQRIDLRGAGSTAVLRNSLRHSPDEGAGPLLQSWTWIGNWRWSISCFPCSRFL